jgi:hypothetical protein
MRALACLLLALTTLLAAGCSTWRATPLPEPAPPAHAVQELGTVRVHLADGRTFELRHAIADGDSLRGDVTVDQRKAYGGTRTAFALRDVQSIESQRFSIGRTVGFAAWMTVSVGLIIAFWIAVEKPGASD